MNSPDDHIFFYPRFKRIYLFANHFTSSIDIINQKQRKRCDKYSKKILHTFSNNQKNKQNQKFKKKNSNLMLLNIKAVNYNITMLLNEKGRRRLGKQIAIIGLGLMGGSLAKALQSKWDVTITGVDQDQTTIETAMAERTIQYGLNHLETLSWEVFDLIIFCTPIEITLQWMERIDGKVKDTATVIDIGSTKGQVMQLAAKVNYDFIGGHPMVGSEKSGYIHSKGHLFENAYFILTPLEQSKEEKITLLYEMIDAIGAMPITMDAEQHDLFTAVISHVPHIIASALVHMIKEFDHKEVLIKLAAGGFKDITRIASSSPHLWQHISLSNKEKIDLVLKQLLTTIDEYKQRLSEENNDYLFTYFSKAKEMRDQIVDTVNTDIPKQYALIVDIEDRPGMIAKISTLLYEHQINIKNIGIIHNREFENGCLKIILENRLDQVSAYQVLQKHEYLVFK